MEFVTLNNGIQMPMLGYGTYQPNLEDTYEGVRAALDCGARLLDTAESYRNQEDVGRAIADSGIDRSELFVDSKIWFSDGGYEKGAAAIDRALKTLGLEYLDLVMIHHPYNDYYGIYRAMEDAYRAGKIRALGVSNFYADRLCDICNFAEIMPAVDQLETHIFWQHKDARAVMEKFGVQHMGWGPLAELRENYLANELINQIALDHGKTAAQVALRFQMQMGVVIIPGSANADHIRENMSILDFSLTDAEMDAIRQLDTDKTMFFDLHDAQTLENMIAFAKDGTRL